MNKKLQEIHFLRAFGAIGVVLLHVLAANQNKFLFINKFIGISLGYVIPLFIFISGFVFSLTYKPENKALSFYKKRFSAIIFPYLIFANLYYLYALYTHSIPEDRVNFSKYFSALITAKTYFHLWFFGMLAQVYLIFPFLIRIYKKLEKHNIIFLISIFVFQVLWGILSDTSPRASLSAILPMFLFYFLLGIYSAQNYEFISKIIKQTNFYILSVIYLILNFIAVKVEFARFIVFPACFILMFIILFKISFFIKDKKSKIVNFIDFIASYSLGIYLIHAFCIDLSKNFLLKLELSTDSFIFNPLLFITTLALSIIGCCFLNYLPFSKYIIGDKR